MSMPITTRNNAAVTASVNAGPARDTRLAQAGALKVIYRFDGEGLRKKDGVLGTGMGAQRDRTHQLVQQQDAGGKWQVHVRSVNEGRINPSVHVFTSNRPVKVEDFNNPGSVLSQKAREATARLNAESNRLPDAAAPQTPSSRAAVPAKQMSTVEWLGQQGRNTVGGVTAAVTSTVGMVGSLPEKTGRFVGSVVDLGRAGVNSVTGGQVAKSALNPMVIDSKVKSRSGPTNAEQGMGWAQGRINKAIGADANSKTYKTVEVLAPLLITRKGKTGGDQGIVRDAAQLKGSAAPKPSSTPVKNGEAPGLPADTMSHIQQTMKSPDFQERLAHSNSNGEIARQNQAIQDMRADGKVTASYIRPEGGGSKPGASDIGRPVDTLQKQVDRHLSDKNPAASVRSYKDTSGSATVKKGGDHLLNSGFGKVLGKLDNGGDSKVAHALDTLKSTIHDTDIIRVVKPPAAGADANSLLYGKAQVSLQNQWATMMRVVNDPQSPAITRAYAVDGAIKELRNVQAIVLDREVLQQAIKNKVITKTEINAMAGQIDSQIAQLENALRRFGPGPR